MMSIVNRLVDRSNRSANTELLFDALADRRRQYVFTTLSKANGPVSIVDLARRVADLETEGTTAATEADVRRVRTSLHHKHVPKLVDLGLAEHDEIADSLTSTDGTADAVHLLDAACRLTV